MQQPKSLYKLARNTMYEKTYFCEECDSTDTKFIQCYVIKRFVCKLCKIALKGNEIIYHDIKNHHREDER